jgi:hypothetical protein
MAEKLLHAEAAYHEFGTPEQHCLVCTMYRQPEKCTLVEDIRWYGWCKYFEREEKRDAA